MAPPPPFGANSAAARDIATVLHPYTDLKTHQEVGPVVISRGKGVRVWDDTGKEYIESVAGLWCAALGFDNERLVQAALASFSIVSVSAAIMRSPSHSLPIILPIAAYFWTFISIASKWGMLAMW